MAENKKFTRLINSDGTKQAVALDMVSFDEQTKKLTLYSSVDNTIKEETTIPASEVDATLSQSGLAADAKATGDAVKDVVKVGGTASGFTGIIVGTGEEEIELVEQKDFDAEIAKLNAKVGTPLVANTASAMVDTTKIYVYTGNENGYVNGNWYFYNGTNWESGGVYNAVAVQTDKTLTQENKAADAKKTGDEISQLKSDLDEIVAGNQPLVIIPNKYIDTNGEEQSYSNWSATDFMPAFGDTLIITALSGGSEGKYNAFYDSNKEYITGSRFAFGGGVTTISIPSGAAYYRLSAKTAKLQQVAVMWWIVEEINKLKEIGYAYDKEYADKLANAKRKANAGSYNSLTSPEVFALAHFSDIHGSISGMKAVQSFRNVFGESLDDTICTGDIVQEKITDGLDFWNNNSDGSILVCIGNHDSLGSDGWSNPVSQETLYNTYIAPYKDNWNAETVTNHSYWYKDYPNSKVRLISVDATIFDSNEQAAQITWLEMALSVAKTNGYSVVGALHFPPIASKFRKIDSNFTALLHGTADDMSQFAWTSYRTEILGAVQQFIDNDGDFVCWLGGHTHYDLISYDADYPKQLFVSISCAMPDSVYEERVRDSSNKSGLILNTVCIDTVRKYVKLLRYGAEWDDCLRHTGTCVIKYDANPPAVIFSN